MKRRTLLCVDDDLGIRELYEVLLGSRGYEVVVADGGPQALNLFHSKEKEIDVVLADYDMPGMNGAELAAELKHCDPGLPIIMVSGCLPILEEAPHFVDAAVEKGAPVEKIAEQIELLLAAHRGGQSPIPQSPYAPLASTLAGVATVAFFLAKLWR